MTAPPNPTAPLDPLTIVLDSIEPSTAPNGIPTHTRSGPARDVRWQEIVERDPAMREDGRHG